MAKRPTNNGASWSASELRTLKQLAKAGTAQAAAKQLGRTPAAVQQKAMRTGISFRAAPSGGALYPLELYAVCHRVEGLEVALYHYDPLLHGLELLGPLTGRAGADLTPYGEVLSDSAAVVAITAVFWRSRFKYGARAYRFTLTEAGHVAQNLLLAATALGLASVPVGGFYDRKVDDFIGVDGIFEGSLYLVPVGHAAG